MTPKNLFTFLLLLFAINVSSQSVKFQETTVGKSIIGISSSYDLSINNQIVKDIATANGVSKAEIIVNYSVKLEIIHQNTNQQLKAFFEVNSIAGDTQYKGFPLTNMTPSKVTFTLKHIKNGVLLQSYTFTNVQFSNLSSEAGNKNATVEPFPSESGVKMKDPIYTLEISDVIFVYDSNNKSKFETQTANINKYYTANTDIQSAITKISAMNTDKNALVNLENLEDVVSYKTLANDYIGLCNKTKTESFYTNLSVSSNDPIGLNRNLETLRAKSNDLLKNTEEIISQFDQLFYQKGMDMLKVNKTQMAQFYFNKSIGYNARYAPSHFQIAKINYDNDNYDGALDILDKILKMSPDDKTLASTNDLFVMIYSDYVDKATNFNTKKDYDNSLIWLKKSSELCNKYKNITPSVAMQNAYSVAYNGKYEIMLASFDAAYKAGNLTNAESALDIASKYQIENSTYITTNTEIVTRHTNIYQKYIANADAFYTSKNYDKALNDYLNAQHICKSVSYIPCNDQLITNIYNSRTGIYTTKIDNATAFYKANNLDQAEALITEATNYLTTYLLVKDARFDKLVIDIKQTRYDKNISDGNTKVTGQDFTNALVNFNLAQDIEKMYGITPNKKLAGLITSTAKSLTLQKIEEGEKKVNINDLASARIIFKEANDLKNKYLLATDKEVVAAITSLNDKIFQQECLNYRSNYDTYYQNAISSIFDADYISADTQLKLAIEITVSHSECMIDATNATYKKIEIEDAVTYQTQIAYAKKEATNKNYQNSIKTYVEAQNFYTEKNIESNFSLTHTDLYTYITQNSEEYINYAVKYYSENSDYDNAFSLLKLLETKAYSNKLTIANQTFVGTQLATRDHNLNPAVDAKVKILEYTANNKWYKYFAKAYKKQLKSMK